MIMIIRISYLYIPLVYEELQNMIADEGKNAQIPKYPIIDLLFCVNYLFKSSFIPVNLYLRILIYTGPGRMGL